MKIIVAGKNSIAVEAVKFMTAKYPALQIFGCINNTDIFRDSWQPSFGKYCIDNSIKLVSLEEAYNMEDSIFLSLEFDKIVNPFKFAHNNIFNIHFSALPAYKGMYTSAIPLLRGENYSGVTLHKIDKGIDTGDIIDQIIFDLSDNLNSEDLYHKYIENGIKLLKSNFQNLLVGKFDYKPQDSFGSTYFSKKYIDYNNVIIDLNCTAYQIHNQIRAFCFRPYQLPEVFGEKIYKSEISNVISEQKPGTIVFSDNYQLTISTIDYDVILYIDQEENLFSACETGDIEKIKLINSKNYPLHLKNSKGWDALIVSAYHNKVDCFKFLLECGLSLHTYNYNKTTIPMYVMTSASRTNDLTLLDYLLTLSPDLKAVDNNGKDILYYANQYKNSSVINKLNKFIQK